MEKVYSNQETDMNILSALKMKLIEKTHNTEHIIEQTYKEEVTILNVCNTNKGSIQLNVLSTCAVYQEDKKYSEICCSEH
jgi:hypothetical protein